MSPGDSLEESTYFQVDWNGDPHAVGNPTATGDLGAPSRIVIGTPTVEEILGDLANRPLVFDTATSPVTVEELQFSLNRGADVYTVAFDAVITGHGEVPGEPGGDGEPIVDPAYGDFSLRFEGLSEHKIVFAADGFIHYFFSGVSLPVGSFRLNETVNLRIQVDLTHQKIYISVDGLPFTNHEFELLGADIETLQFVLNDKSRGDGRSGIDNVEISGFTNPLPPPPADLNIPTGLSLDESTMGEIVLSWSPVTGAEHYVIYRRSIGETGFTYLDFTSETEYLDYNLIPGRPYGYQVAAFGEIEGQPVRSGLSPFVIGFAGHVLADLALGRTIESYLGDGVHNDTANGQRYALLLGKRGAGAFRFSVSNAGEAAGAMYVQGSRHGRFVRAYFIDRTRGGNVTGALLRGNLTTDELAPGEANHFECNISVRIPERFRKRRKRLYRQDFIFSAQGTYSQIRQDVVHAATVTIIPKEKKKRKKKGGAARR